MYRIERNHHHLLVRFNQEFDCKVVEAVIHHLMLMKEYPDTNDIWLIGKHRADIRLGEIETMVRTFQCHCPRDATRSRTAIVIDEGLTGSIVELWVEPLQLRVDFNISIFRSLEEAEAWIDIGAERVA